MTIRTGVIVNFYQNLNVLSASCLDSCAKKLHLQLILWGRYSATVFFLSIIFQAKNILFFYQVWHLHRCKVGEYTCKRKIDLDIYLGLKYIDTVPVEKWREFGLTLQSFFPYGIWREDEDSVAEPHHLNVFLKKLPITWMSIFRYFWHWSRYSIYFFWRVEIKQPMFFVTMM